jgi:hypothetical protein
MVKRKGEGRDNTTYSAGRDKADKINQASDPRIHSHALELGRCAAVRVT